MCLARHETHFLVKCLRSNKSHVRHGRFWWEAFLTNALVFGTDPSNTPRKEVLNIFSPLNRKPDQEVRGGGGEGVGFKALRFLATWSLPPDTCPYPFFSFTAWLDFFSSIQSQTLQKALLCVGAV